MKELKGFPREQLEKFLVGEGFKALNATQVYELVFKKNASAFSQMTNLSKDLREFLPSVAKLSSLTLKDKQVSADGTVKYLFGLHDGYDIETVLIPEPDRKTLCVSTQVGCKRKCVFCVSGKDGFVRDLESWEIVAQVMQVNADMGSERISNIVFMGVGEPLDNYDNLMAAIDVIRDGKGIYIGKRKISISTCGVVPSIERMVREGKDVRLSVSLHAVNDELRNELMPVNRVYPIAELTKALMRFTQAFGFPVFFEYIMIHDVNVSKKDADELAALLKRVHGKVNLIAYNPTPHFKWQAPTDDDCALFKRVLTKQNVFFTFRKSRGQDIAAACGQLRAEKTERGA
jgi:23S rRNA (adenine2503-C2)-methyltransferase